MGEFRSMDEAPGLRPAVAITAEEILGAGGVVLTVEGSRLCVQLGERQLVLPLDQALAELGQALRQSVLLQRERVRLE